MPQRDRPTHHFVKIWIDQVVHRFFELPISEITYELVKDDPAFTFTARGLVSAKGKGEMEMYFVERSQD
jgi:hypothetical protein